MVQMPIQITATVLGHPWDLWGLAQLFDGSDSIRTVIKATKPKGRPTFDNKDPAQITRFRVHGYDLFATIACDLLLWDGRLEDIDLRDYAPIAEELLARMNGIAALLDTNYAPLKLFSLDFSDGENAGSWLRSEWTPNKAETHLGVEEEHLPFAQQMLPLATTNPAVKVVLAAITLPRTWSSMYLIYEAIADAVGGQPALEKLNFIHKNDLIAFRKTANNNRSIDEGMRHSKKPEPVNLIPLNAAYMIINTLAVRWMQSLMTS
jgi:hypothetical protein